MGVVLLTRVQRDCLGLNPSRLPALVLEAFNQPQYSHHAGVSMLL